MSAALTMRTMLGLATSMAAKLSLLRSHPVMRATTASLADRAVSGVRPELWSHSCHRLRRVSYLLLVPRPEPTGIYGAVQLGLWGWTAPSLAAESLRMQKPSVLFMGVYILLNAENDPKSNPEYQIKTSFQAYWL